MTEVSSETEVTAELGCTPGCLVLLLVLVAAAGVWWWLS